MRLAKGRLDRELKWFVCALCGTRCETGHAHSLTPEAPIEEYARTLSFLHVTHQDGRAKLISENTVLAAPDANPAPGSALTIVRDSEGVMFLSGSVEASGLAGLRLGNDSLLDIEIGGPEFQPMQSVKGLAANAALINQSMVSAVFALAAPGPKPPLSIISLETTAGFFVFGREETQENAQVALTPLIADVRGKKSQERGVDGPRSGSFEPTEALTKLVELHDRGLISDEELAAARARIIERLTS